MLKTRIFQVRKALKLNQVDFASRLGLTGSAISLLESGDRNPSETVIRAICREYNVDYVWLKTGEGDMFEQPTTESDMALIDAVMSGESEFAKSFFRAFAKMPLEEWKKLTDFTRSLLAEADANDAQKK